MLSQNKDLVMAAASFISFLTTGVDLSAHSKTRWKSWRFFLSFSLQSTVEFLGSWLRLSKIKKKKIPLVIYIRSRRCESACGFTRLIYVFHGKLESSIRLPSASPLLTHFSPSHCAFGFTKRKRKRKKKNMEKFLNCTNIQGTCTASRNPASPLGMWQTDSGVNGAPNSSSS